VSIADRKGFTLPELLVSLVIIAILSAVAAPGLSAMIENYRVKATARQLASDLQLARMKAVTQNTPYEIIVDTANTRYKLALNSLTQTEKDALSWQNLGETTKGVSMNKTFAGTEIVFTAIGEVVDNTGQPFATDPTITVKTPRTTQRTITIGGNGRISIG
jgi:prepilin-type N-terminal cleavage/methylation domain-containing protein